MNNDSIQRLVERMRECQKTKKSLVYSQADKFDEILISYELNKPEDKEYSSIVVAGRIGEYTYVLSSVNVGSGVIKLSELIDIKID